MLMYLSRFLIGQKGSLANLLYRGNYIVDWRVVAYLMYSYVWIEQGFKGFYYNYYPEKDITLMYAGSYAF